MTELLKALTQVPEILARLSQNPKSAEGPSSFLREPEFSRHGQWGWESPAPDDNNPDMPTSTGIQWCWEEPALEGKPYHSGQRARIFIPWPQDNKNGYVISTNY